MAITNSGAYLIVARYNREKWKLLRTDKDEKKDERHLAEGVAEKLFPEDDPYVLPYLTAEQRDELRSQLEDEESTYAQRLSNEQRNSLRSQLEGGPSNLPAYLSGLRIARTFRSDVFERLAGMGIKNFPDRSPDEKDKILDIIYDGKIRLRIPVGWMAVIDGSTFAPFMQEMNGAGGIFWRIYDITTLPLEDGWTNEDVYSRVGVDVRDLHNDLTTLDIYTFMTPTNWSG